MFKKARFVLNLLQNYKKIGENLQLYNAQRKVKDK